MRKYLPVCRDRAEKIHSSCEKFSTGLGILAAIAGGVLTIFGAIHEALELITPKPSQSAEESASNTGARPLPEDAPAVRR